jgi:pyruvate/2-oxoglutarate dehydrogenase complex dihydrolipoamide acyltransferase (E2) component
VTEDRASEALEKLNRGIQESKRMVQHQTMELAQEYFGDSVGALKQQIEDNRATLKKLPEQIPGGQEEPFHMLFQELMDNYARIEETLKEAEKNVANLDTEQLRKQGEVDASDAARREARELGIDLTEVEGTGSGGRIIVDDVKSFAEKTEHRVAEKDEAEEESKASDAAKRKAEELGVDLSEVIGSGSEGRITVKDVTNNAEGAEEEAAGLAEQVADQTGDAASQAGDVVEQAAERTGGAVDQAAGQAEQAARRDRPKEPRATNAAKRKAEELGIDLSGVKGSGAGGLITIRDIVKP